MTSRFKFFLLVFLLGNFTVAVFAFDGSGKWKLAKNKNGIKVFTKKSGTSLLDDSKATVIINAPIIEVFKVLTDIERQNQWMDRVKISRLLKKVSDNEFYTYYEAVAPWPIANRDIVSRYKIKHDASGKITVLINGEPDFIPRKESLVRIQNVVSSWELIPVDANTVEVIYTNHSDPGGNVPEWLVNATVADNPYNTLKSLRDRVEGK